MRKAKFRAPKAMSLKMLARETSFRVANLAFLAPIELHDVERLVLRALKDVVRSMRTANRVEQSKISHKGSK